MEKFFLRSWSWVWLYLYGLFPWHARWNFWRRRFRRKGQRRELETFLTETGSLTTPWRLAAYAESRIQEDPGVPWWVPPQDAFTTWARGRAGIPDFARFAQETMARNGFETLLLTVLVPPVGAPRRPTGAEIAADPLLLPALENPDQWCGHVVCVIRDRDGGGWFHFSNWGMFGLYPDLDHIAADISPRWAAYLTRGLDLRVVRWRRREERGGRSFA